MVVQKCSDKLVKDVLNDWYNVYNGFQMRLFRNNFTPTQTSVVADFTEANFNGYAAVNLALPSQNFDASGHIAYFLSTAITFTKSAGATTNTIYGAYVVFTNNQFGGTDMGIYIIFDVPVGMVNTGDSITITPVTWLQAV